MPGTSKARKARQENARKATESRKSRVEEVPDEGDAVPQAAPTATQTHTNHSADHLHNHDHADPEDSWDFDLGNELPDIECDGGSAEDDSDLDEEIISAPEISNESELENGPESTLKCTQNEKTACSAGKRPPKEGMKVKKAGAEVQKNQTEADPEAISISDNSASEQSGADSDSDSDSEQIPSNLDPFTEPELDCRDELHLQAVAKKDGHFTAQSLVDIVASQEIQEKLDEAGLTKRSISI
ncbi:hypothetical protein B0H17DRAFT_1217719 [Mycena rosella]|uniref:Uncharacterized protein n=1 Tax=Mycena rosella TaxID=1033263 RepID=A0AAD7BV88_MYCRO|nr:hypothetical protein B0H17DRAFT_1217719 [Mycena rosella]